MYASESLLLALGAELGQWGLSVRVTFDAATYGLQVEPTSPRAGRGPLRN